MKMRCETRKQLLLMNANIVLNIELVLSSRCSTYTIADSSVSQKNSENCHSKGVHVINWSEDILLIVLIRVNMFTTQTQSITSKIIKNDNNHSESYKISNRILERKNFRLGH